MTSVFSSFAKIVDRNLSAQWLTGVVYRLSIGLYSIQGFYICTRILYSVFTGHFLKRGNCLFIISYCHDERCSGNIHSIRAYVVCLEVTWIWHATKDKCSWDTYSKEDSYLNRLRLFIWDIFRKNSIVASSDGRRQFPDELLLLKRIQVESSTLLKICAKKKLSMSQLTKAEKNENIRVTQIIQMMATQSSSCFSFSFNYALFCLNS